MNTLNDNPKTDMKSLISCSNMLDKLGFTTQFQATPTGLKSLTTGRLYTAAEVTVVNFYRFEGESNPDDNAILYAIESNNGERGTLVDAYGPSNDINVSAFMLQVDDIKKKVNKEHNL